MQRFVLALIAAISVSAGIFAQQKAPAPNRALIEGVVLDASDSKTPISFATIQFLPQDVFVMSDEAGKFEMKNIEPGKTNLKISFIGMETIDTLINIIPNKVYQLKFLMRESNFRLEEVMVVATQNKAGQATASNISRQAMDHLQTSSLRDVMQLMPGATIENPDMSKSNVFTIRTIKTSSTDDNTKLNSLGTAIIMDGAPLSNNANMQALAPVINGGGSSVGGGADPGSGVDLRSVSTDNIESMEVIRGIASVEYGDMTSGAVIIRSKAGKEPLQIRFKTNPYTYQVSAMKGMELGKNKGSLNVSGDYSYSNRSQTEAYVYYQNFNFKALYSKTFFDKLSTNTSLDLSYGLDKRDKNPDDIRNQLSTSARDIGFRLNTNGVYNLSGNQWLNSIRYSFQFSYKDKKSHNEELLGNAFAAYSMSMTDGGVLSNKPGQDLFDNNGNKITNIVPGENNYYATYLPNEYFSKYDIYGKEINFFGKINANFMKRWENGISNRILVGIDYKLDGNNGKGIVYDLNFPPQRTGNASAYRPRAFSDVPFVNQLGIYVQDYFNWVIDGKREFNVTAGARFDYVNGKTVIAPRVNASIDIFPDIFTIRGGYGIFAKAPTSLYLYPDRAYFDYVNFNNLGSSLIPESDQLFMCTTRVFDTENKDLEIAKNTKYEAGFDLRISRVKISATAYQEKMKNGYTFGRDLDCFNLIPYETYKLASKVPGGIYQLELDQRYNVFASYSKPLNTINIDNKGLEYEIDFGRIRSIRTSFYINGAWMKTSTKDMSHSFSTSSNLNDLERNIGVYEQGKTTSCRENFNTTIRISHNIPKIGFLFTVTAQVNWKTKIWNEYGNDTMFEKYISRIDGKVYDFDPAKKDDPEFAYLFPSLNDNRFIAETYQPTVLFNFMLSKEIGSFLTASFFVNNMFNSRPKYESKKNPGSFTELGIPTFFGFDVKINIK